MQCFEWFDDTLTQHLWWRPNVIAYLRTLNTRHIAIYLFKLHFIQDGYTFCKQQFLSWRYFLISPHTIDYFCAGVDINNDNDDDGDGDIYHRFYNQITTEDKLYSYPFIIERVAL